MTNIDLNSVEYHSDLAGLQNTGSFDFSYVVPAQSLDAFPAGPNYGIMLTNILTEVEITDKILDFQVTFPGLDSRRFYFSSYIQQYYTQSPAPTDDRTVPANVFEVNITTAVSGKSLKMLTYIANYSGSAFITPSFTVKGTVVVYEAPFKIT